MLTILEELPRLKWARVPQFRVQCSECGSVYVTAAWRWSIKRTRQCIDCHNRNRRRAKMVAPARKREAEG